MSLLNDSHAGCLSVPKINAELKVFSCSETKLITYLPKDIKGSEESGAILNAIVEDFTFKKGDVLSVSDSTQKKLWKKKVEAIDLLWVKNKPKICTKLKEQGPKIKALLSFTCCEYSNLKKLPCPLKSSWSVIDFDE